MASLFGASSSRQHESELHNPALCEELRIRDILDSVGVMTNGTFVAAYELSGVHFLLPHRRYEKPHQGGFGVSAHPDQPPWRPIFLLLRGT